MSTRMLHQKELATIILSGKHLCDLLQHRHLWALLPQEGPLDESTKGRIGWPRGTSCLLPRKGRSGAGPQHVDSPQKDALAAWNCNQSLTTSDQGRERSHDLELLTVQDAVYSRCREPYRGREPYHA